MKIGKYSIYFERPKDVDATKSYAPSVFFFLAFKFAVLSAALYEFTSPDPPVGTVGAIVWFLALFVWLFWEEIRRFRIEKKN
ncbi:hypothetical protein [uncultured Roseobacter sp.]|uniref:hypothetical protein n=1 Tax=uncultured Roseobacter sp. TaxID=114847 RepID=UPI0026209E5A|nr:hypothetical protein [uncultured Roseobacter sp.]